MEKSMRKSTLESLGLGNVISIFKNGKMPVEAGDLVDEVFGKAGERGAFVVSGANGIVGAGKMMQLGVRLQPYDIPLVGLDMPGAPDGLGLQYQGLAASFGKAKADSIMSNMIQLYYDGSKLPSQLEKFKPRFLLEAIPEILGIKKAHFDIFTSAFPGIEIRSVTSGFPMAELGVGIAHPAFPHQINKIWEIVEKEPSKITQLFWALGMIPVPVSDNWSFVLDVLFCGLTLAGLRYHQATNMPFWKIDKYVRKYIGPNPFRAHDVIGAKGANFLTWSCLHHLSNYYGDVFTPTKALNEHKDSGSNWYPLNHLRPIVNWTMDDDGYDVFNTWINGPLYQMASLMLKEERSHLSIMNSIGELCAQFRKGILAAIREAGAENVVETVEKYHTLHPEAAKNAWHPEVFENMDSAEWQQLYVNAEHDGKVGIITLARESYNHDVNAELNRAIDWLKAGNIDNVIITGDFHLSTQLVGADTSEFYPALNEEEAGFNVAFEWAKTARRLNDEFRNSVAFINGKRCLGGMLELFVHCHYLVSVDDADLGAPEVTLPVVPGMEMCHWPFRKATADDWPKLQKLLLEGRPVKARDAQGWLTDFSGPMNEAIAMAWKLAAEGDGAMPRRPLNTEPINNIPGDLGWLRATENPSMISARKAIYECIVDSCSKPIAEANDTQARHSARFMLNKHCQRGFVGSDYKKTMLV